MNRTEQSTTGKMRVHPAAINLLTDATWDYAHAILWDGQPFSQAETALAKTFIREYYEAIPAEKFYHTSSRHFTGYCERVLLARDYVKRFPHRYIPHPCIWLNKLNPKGFAGTKAWYDRVQEKRRRNQKQQPQQAVEYILIPLHTLRYYPHTA